MLLIPPVVALLPQKTTRQYHAICVPEGHRKTGRTPIYSPGFFFCSGIVLLSSDNQAYVAHFRPRGIDIARGWPDQEISTARNLLHREDLVMFALSTMQQDIEAIEKSAEREGVKISGFYKGVYEHVYDEKRDDVVMKAEEKDILVLPEERIVRLYREYSERLEFKL